MRAKLVNNSLIFVDIIVLLLLFLDNRLICRYALLLNTDADEVVIMY